MGGQILGGGLVVSGGVAGNRLQRDFLKVFEGLLQRAQREQLRLIVPRSHERMVRLNGLRYFFQPEMVYQMEGHTEIIFPAGQVSVLPGELAIVPRGLPHALNAFSGRNPFRNLTLNFYSSTISCHFGREAAANAVRIDALEFYVTPNLPQLVNLVELMVQEYHKRHHARETVVRSLLVAFLALIVNLLERPVSSHGQDSAKTFQVKWLVREELHNPKLNVKNLAERLHCSADYLSNLFKKDTGETLIHYIHRQRIEGAKVALESTHLSVSEIAWATGFSDPGYFTRVFKQFTGLTPVSYRRRGEEGRRSATEGGDGSAPPENDRDGH